MNFPIGTRVLVATKKDDGSIQTLESVLYSLFEAQDGTSKISIFHEKKKLVYTFPIQKIKYNANKNQYFCPIKGNIGNTVFIFYPEEFLYSRVDMDKIMKGNATQGRSDLQPDEQVITKIKKLFSLSGNNPSQKEAEVAMLKAQELMAKYGLEMSDVDTNPVDKEIIHDYTSDIRRILWWEKNLSYTIGKNFRCISLTQRYNNGTGCVFFVGYEEDTKIAKETYEYANQYIRYAVNEYAKQNQGTLREVRNQWISGFLKGLETRFDEQVNANQWALVVVPDKKIQDYVDNTVKPRKPQSSLVKMGNNQEAYKAGYKDGYNRNMKKPQGHVK